MLRQIESGVQNSPFIKNGLLRLTASFFGKFNLTVSTSYKLAADLKFQTSIFVSILLVSAWVFFQGIFSQWLSLKRSWHREMTLRSLQTHLQYLSINLLNFHFGIFFGSLPTVASSIWFLLINIYNSQDSRKKKWLFL